MIRVNIKTSIEFTLRNGATALETAWEMVDQCCNYEKRQPVVKS